MQIETELAVLPEFAENTGLLISLTAKQQKIEQHRIKGLKIVKRSIDARGRQVLFRLRVRLFIDEPEVTEVFSQNYANIAGASPVIIIGAGPAGLFAALQCIENNLKPIILERGKAVQERRRDLAILNREGVVDTDSNYCFGEGGAGTYSDGKLYTRSNKRGDVQKVLELLVAHGAPDDILVDARPHIGTNKLPHIIKEMRAKILAFGGEIHFNSRVVDIETSFAAVTGVKTADGATLKAEHIIVATGHSARDVFSLFRQKGLLLEAKPFALGVRIEHPQEIIDRAQYHCDVRSEFLPPAYYSLVEQVGSRGVFSFCMCPGGIIVPCATAAGEVVVNGWSPSKRNNPHANSGTVVQVTLQDVLGMAGPSAAADDPFALLRFQQEVEQQAFLAGGGHLVAPAQRMVDYVNNKLSADLPVNSYKPGLASADLGAVLPPFIHQALQKALPAFGKKMKGYFTNEAVLVGVESRTSSPVRIPRDKETFQHPQVKGLYPCGEGAGYAGGIVSAAIDGMNCADAIKKAAAF